MARRRVLLLCLGLVVVGAMVLVALPSGRTALVSAVGWLRAGGVTGRLAAIGVALVGIPLGIPTLWFAAMIGYLYGTAGLAVSLPAVLVGATAAFWIARRLLAEEVVRLVERRRRWRAVVAGVGDGGARLVVLLRLAGPHNLLNLVLAASPVTAGEFVVGTAIGSLPSVALATLGGALAPDAASLWQARSQLGAAWIAVAVAGAAALVVAVVVTWRASRRALDRLDARAAAAMSVSRQP